MPAKKIQPKATNGSNELDALLTQLEQSIKRLESGNSSNNQLLTQHIDARFNNIEDHLSSHALRIDNLENSIITLSNKFDSLSVSY